ncbi:DAK2 domain-containing protein [Calidifontibacter terrae]
MALATLDLFALRRWVVVARTDLAQFADRINALNVFPVPDADTGTNLLLTLDGAMGSLTFEDPDDLGAAANDLATATLMAARGNSGVILSQLARAVAEVLTASADGCIGPADLARALRRASDYAWRSVSSPVEGTILTVAAAAADGAELADSASLTAVVDGAVASAKAALLHTTDQLEALRAAGVIDAGGAGYLLILESLQRVVESDTGLVGAAHETPDWLGEPSVALTTLDCHDGELDGPSYEVMYLLSDTTGERVDRLRSTLHKLGNSLVVAGGPQTWSIHVHVDDVGAALNAGVEAGRPHRFAITRFADEMLTRTLHMPVTHDARTLVVAVAEAEGLAELARSEGRTVVAADAGRLARSTATRAMRETGLTEVLLIADGEIASQTCDLLQKSLRDKGIRVIRPGASGPVEFLTALAVAHPDSSGDDVLAAVDSALIDLSTAVVEVAEAELETVEGVCPRGELYGAIDGEVITHAAQALPVAARLLELLITERDAELVTLVTGVQAPAALADTLRVDLARRHPDVEVSVVDGRGPHVLAIGVE